MAAALTAIALAVTILLVLPPPLLLLQQQLLLLLLVGVLGWEGKRECRGGRERGRGGAVELESDAP